jgi:hypothetical protein
MTQVSVLTHTISPLLTVSSSAWRNPQLLHMDMPYYQLLADQRSTHTTQPPEPTTPNEKSY